MLKFFSVYDSKAEAYVNPFTAPTTALAMRSFGAAANQEGHDFQKYSADYTLFEIGTFDPATGHLEALKAHANLGTALSFITQELHLARSERA